MSLKVKICGITTLEDARFCAGAGADFLGFIQYNKSPRYVAPKEVKAILEWIYGPKSVGVFVGESTETINRIVAETGFDYAQLHGDETPEACAAVEAPVIKAIRVEPGADGEALRRRMAPFQPHVDYFLLDTHHADRWGGTGTPFDWQQARDLSGDFPILLAGGLRPGNVAAAAEAVRPAGVDVSSGVEAAPGRKDFDKVTAFFDALRVASST